MQITALHYPEFLRRPYQLPRSVVPALRQIRQLGDMAAIHRAFFGDWLGWIGETQRNKTLR